MLKDKNKIKPIETKYKGYFFRSRLEARWAVFFDALGIKFEYESEGYDLGDGVWYLPDFYFPNGLFGVDYAEVKPYQGDYYSPMKAFGKITNFIFHKKCRFVLLDGPPNFTFFYVVDWPAGWIESCFREGALGIEEFLWQPGCFCCDAADKSPDGQWLLTPKGVSRTEFEAWRNVRTGYLWEPRYREAVYAARSARF